MKLIRRISNDKIFIAIIAAVAATIVGFLVNHWIKGSVKLQVTLYQSIPNPHDNGKIQFMVINNEGSCAARDVRVRVEYQRIIEPLDYRIESLDTPEDVLRTDSYLSFKVPRLAANDFLIVVFALGDRRNKT